MLGQPTRLQWMSCCAFAAEGTAHMHVSTHVRSHTAAMSWLHFSRLMQGFNVSKQDC